MSSTKLTMTHSRVCSATVSSLAIFTGIVLVVHVVTLTLTDLEKFNELPTEEMVPMPVLVCLAALLAMVGGNLGFAGSVSMQPSGAHAVPLLWAVSCVVIALVLETAALVSIYTLVKDDEMDDELQDIYYEVKLSTTLVVGIAKCVQLVALDYYLYLLDVKTLCFRSYMCWPNCFTSEDDDDSCLMLECNCERASEHESERTHATEAAPIMMH